MLRCGGSECMIEPGDTIIADTVTPAHQHCPAASSAVWGHADPDIHSVDSDSGCTYLK